MFIFFIFLRGMGHIQHYSRFTPGLESFFALLRIYAVLGIERVSSDCMQSKHFNSILYLWSPSLNVLNIRIISSLLYPIDCCKDGKKFIPMKRSPTRKQELKFSLYHIMSLYVLYSGVIFLARPLNIQYLQICVCNTLLFNSNCNHPVDVVFQS